MFTLRSSHGRALHSPFILINQRFISSTRCRRSRAAPTTTPIKPHLQPHGPVAEQLSATGLWDPISRPPRGTAMAASTKTAKERTKKTPKAVGDKSRVNVVSDKLCDDILSYIGPSLERHRGCDIIDLFPGAGLWSSKLHQFLEPRSHLLLEPDDKLYQPFLQPLLDQPGTTLIPKSGIIWRELSSVLNPEFLPHQVTPEDHTVRNDTLLVTANFCLHPKRKFLRFDSIARLVLHQFIDAIRTGALFQRYGRVRMLIWATPEDMASFLPKTIQKRRRQAIECDFTLESMHEVCGKELTVEYYIRDEAIDQASLEATIKRMRAANIRMPAGRESAVFLEGLRRKKVPVPGMQPPTMTRRYHNILSDLAATNAEKGGLDKESAEFKKMKIYGWRAATDIKKGERFHNLTQGLDNILALRVARNADPAEIAAAEYAWQLELRDLPKTNAFEFQTYKDNLYSFRGKPPLLRWDQRAYEPMIVQPEEFFPQVECNLMDIQPRAPHPLLLQSGPRSQRSADICDVLEGSLMLHPTQAVGPLLDSIWPGAADYILPRWKSGQDPSCGGFPLHLHGAELNPRLMDCRQWEELFELWMEWPFRPEFHELVGRAGDDLDEDNDDSGPAGEL